MKKLILLSIILLLSGSSVILGQEVSVKTFGVSPRDVARDTIELYFDRAYNGLMNVGNETKVYLQGKSDEALSNPTWTILIKPGGSAALLGATKDVDSSTQIINFTPDVTGTYKIEFKDGTAADTIVINSALYLGVEGGAVSCIGCHNTELWDYKYDKWLQTGHASMLERGLNGTLSSHYGENCISCHTVGYDVNASNDGFDDFPFVFPDSLYPGVYEQMQVLYPEAMARANIQCESCHGPGSAHLGIISNSKMVDQIEADNCALCHDSGTHHYFPEQWDYSGHGKQLYPRNSSSCAPCHNGLGFIEWVKGGKVSLTSNIPEDHKISCATCHDPHDASLEHQLRTLDATLLNGFEVTESMAGNGAICMNCHKSRRDAVTYVNDYLNNLSRFGPHHGPQSELLIGTNVYTWGQNLPSSPHLQATENACASCHMTEEVLDMGTDIPYAGMHTFSMTFPDGTDNVAACEPCHGEIGEEFADKKYYYNGNADLDGDGVAQGLQHEIEGLLDTLLANLPPIGPGIFPVDSSWTLDEAAAYYNYLIIEEDRSKGIHNPQFAVSLLYLSILKAGGPVLEVEIEDTDIPSDFGLSQNYPNPFNPSTTIEFSVPTQSNVKIVIYDALGNLLDVIYEGLTEAGSYKVNWNAANYASGIYFCRMESDRFIQVRKMLLMK